jgi:phenylalanyl-tRNA synthetase beta chain
MKVSIDWLKEYVQFDGLPSVNWLTPFPCLGWRLRKVEKNPTPNLDKVVVGEVLSKRTHPEADRLSVCSVQVSTDQGEPANIVCGATNFKVGDRVPVALPGAKLPGGFKIKKSKLRGVSLRRDDVQCGRTRTWAG